MIKKKKNKGLCPLSNNIQKDPWGIVYKVHEDREV